MPSPDELRAMAERATMFGSVKERRLAKVVIDLLAENERLRNTCKLGRDTILIATACCAQSPGEEREIEATIRAIDAVLEEPAP